VSEAQLQAMVIDLAKWCGYLVYHTVDSRRSQPGFPDLTMIHTRNGRLIFVELKSEKGRIRPEQKVWLEHLGRHHEVYIWRPAHWHNGTIRSVLAAETRRAAA
jgi:hypothetical protein